MKNDNDKLIIAVVSSIETYEWIELNSADSADTFCKCYVNTYRNLCFRNVKSKVIKFDSADQKNDYLSKLFMRLVDK